MPRSGRLETREIPSLTVQETGSPKSRCRPCRVLLGSQGGDRPPPRDCGHPGYPLAVAASLPTLPVFGGVPPTPSSPFFISFSSSLSPTTVHGDGVSEASKGRSVPVLYKDMPGWLQCHAASSPGRACKIPHVTQVTPAGPGGVCGRLSSPPCPEQALAAGLAGRCPRARRARPLTASAFCSHLPAQDAGSQEAGQP